jgi:hypothetical protein
MAENESLEGEVQDAGDPLVTALVKINVTDAVLAAVRKEAESFPTPKAGDKETYEKIRAHRLALVKLRTKSFDALDAIGKEAFEFHRKVTGKRGEIVANIQASEAIDKAKEQAYLDAEQAIQDELDRKEQIRVDALIAQLTAYEWNGNRFEVAQDTPAQYAERLAKAQESFRLIEAGRKAEAERKAKEEQEARELAEANRKEAERLARVQAEQEAAAAKLKADQEAFEKRQREAQEVADRAERERLAKIAEDERKAREAAETETRRLQAIADQKAKEEADAKAAEAEKARLAELAPDIDKMLSWAKSVWGCASNLPEVKDPVIKGRLSEALKDLEKLLADLRMWK